MNQRLLGILRCPFCTREFRLSSQQLDGNAEVSSGILTCECHRFPVIAGIPILREHRYLSSAVNLVEAGRPEQALLGLMLSEVLPLRRRVQSRAAFVSRLPGFARLNRLVADRRLAKLIRDDAGGMTFAGLVHEVSLARTYFMFRFSDPAFLTTLAVAGIMRPGHLILDVGCGAGHLAYAASTWLGLGPIVGLDRAFRALWLAKRFLVPSGDFVCCDADRGLPFHDGAITYVFSSDTLHTIAAKRTAAAEMARVVAREGAIILAHLPNKRARSRGWPLTPEGYASLFTRLRVLLLRDSVVLDNFLSHRPVELINEDGPAAFGDEPSVSLIASQNDAIFGTYPARDLHFRDERLRINPLYQTRDTGSELRLRLRLPTAGYEREFGGLRKYLPEEISIPKRYLSDRTSPEAAAHRAALVKRFILIDLPDRYI